jgi:hypothetical protein
MNGTPDSLPWLQWERGPKLGVTFAWSRVRGDLVGCKHGKRAKGARLHPQQFPASGVVIEQKTQGQPCWKLNIQESICGTTSDKARMIVRRLDSLAPAEPLSPVSTSAIPASV